MPRKKSSNKSTKKIKVSKPLKKSSSKKQTDKDKYRKKSYSPPKETIQIDIYSKLIIREIKKFLKSKPHNQSKDLLNKFSEIGKNGGNLKIIIDAIEFFKKDEEKLLILLSEKENATEYNKRIKDLGNKKKPIKGAVSQIMNLIPLENEYKIILNEPKENLNPRRKKIMRLKSERIEAINKELKEVKSLLTSIMRYYFSAIEDRTYLLQGLSGEKITKMNNKKRVSQLLNDKIVCIVSELRRIGYSDKT